MVLRPPVFKRARQHINEDSLTFTNDNTLPPLPTVAFTVSNTDPSGPGSLRDTYELLDNSSQTIDFSTSGTITQAGDWNLQNKSNFVIDGSSAPNGGICCKYGRVLFTNNHNFRLRHIRFRIGDEQGGSRDGLSFHNCSNVLIENCSISWGLDECVESFNSTDIRFHKCMIYEPLSGKVGIVQADASGTQHNQTRFYQCLFAHASHRPNCNGGLADFVNCVFYNYSSYPINLARTQTFDTLANVESCLFKGGPEALYLNNGDPVVANLRTLNVDSNPSTFTFLNNSAIATDTGAAVYRSQDVTGATVAANRIVSRYSEPIGTILSSSSLFESIKANIGATLPKRDSADARIIADFENGTGSKITSQTQVGGWPDLTV